MRLSFSSVEPSNVGPLAFLFHHETGSLGKEIGVSKQGERPRWIPNEIVPFGFHGPDEKKLPPFSPRNGKRSGLTADIHERFFPVLPSSHGDLV